MQTCQGKIATSKWNTTFSSIYSLNVDNYAYTGRDLRQSVLSEEQHRWHMQKTCTSMKSENCSETSFGPLFIAFSSSLSLDLRAFTSSVMLSTDNLKSKWQTSIQWYVHELIHDAVVYGLWQQKWKKTKSNFSFALGSHQLPFPALDTRCKLHCT